ncbi:hypothetical protein MCOR27_000355 [Pyricularia oryzae]|uniref:C2H2-type domain-containing protein n=2 Tax=Pyricularia TaxID=48558 RepID=A0ABQ8NR01_PYRGI|nr:hypothetical protein MCOR01_000830 [Pyricularia oryzae]KAI6300881.1 hypothetical protein MCOR33_003506 [Pyricularia grisea]KAI6259976.1 hypothetical protein MCOR19_003699 [Pyricularia oryzae]KAI6285495.1 hypothetical protein MCOR26_001471 [Pyricularia oryzae]KAI6289320.1 hypothetical protein MCOR27_000355 [Pyricularia oryzae]
MDGKKRFVPSLLGDPGYDHRQVSGGAARALSPAPSGRFSLRRVSLSPSSLSSSSVASSTCASTCGPKDTSLSPENSCVSRDTSDGDCGRYRFIAWAAVKRNACQGMTPSEKLECPLLRCRRRCESHEEMLRHLAGCDQLGTCEYWCYSHMRVERFDDKKCQRCLTQKSKRRRMLCRAKNFFSSLGHKGRKNGATGLPTDFGDDDDESLMFPVASLRYNMLEVGQTYGYELSGNAIVEIDSTEVAPPVAPSPPTPAVVDPQVLLLPEVDTRMLVAPNPLMQWRHDIACAPQSIFAEPVPSPEERPPLQVNTFGIEQYLQSIRFRPKPRPNPVPASRSKDLSPSSSVRSTNSTTSTASDVSHTSSTSATSNVSSLVSPISAFSHSSLADGEFAKHLVSPEDVLMGQDDLLLDQRQFDQHDVPTSIFDSICPPAELLHGMFTELPADFPPPKVDPTNLPTNSLLFDFDTTAYPVAATCASDLLLTQDANFDSSLEIASHSKTQSPASVEADVKTPQSATEALVGSTWDTLLEHIASSKLKVQDINDNPWADKLRSLASMTIARDGFSALRSLLDGCPPTSPIKILCLVHVVYALSLVVYGDDHLSQRSRELYVESLVYARMIGDIKLEALMTAIWQPVKFSVSEISQGLRRKYKSLHRSPSHKGKESTIDLKSHVAYNQDPLLCTARDFLDELECSAILRPSPKPSHLLTSTLYSKQIGLDFQGTSSTSFVTVARTVIVQLAKNFTGHGDLLLGLQDIHKRLSSGSILSIRRLEIELLYTGKNCLPMRAYFGKYTNATGQACDQMYHQFIGSSANRTVYHGLDLGFLEMTVEGLNRGGTDSTKTALPTSPLGADNEGDALFDDFINAMTPSLMGTMADESIAMQLNPEMMVADSSKLELGSPYGSSTGEASDVVVVCPVGFDKSLTLTSGPLSVQPSGSYSSSTTPSSSTSTSGGTTTQGKTEANSCCELCGYRPKGDPQWFKGSMAKHMKLQHSAQPPKIYKCPYPGCNSAYKNRPDNLRQHQIEKGHFVEGEEPNRRPSKRKKMSE